MADSLISGFLSTPGPATGIDAPSQKTDSPQKIKDAAGQFESLMVGQILKSAHEEEGGWMGAGEEDQTSTSTMQMADEYFARALTAQGGLGLARMITQSLDQASASAAAEAASRSNPAKK
jgi:Rod binding domain-containing protein